MKKTIIALAVAGFSFSAVAADLTKAEQVAGKNYPLYAKEIAIAAEGTDVAGTAAAAGTQFSLNTKVFLGTDIKTTDERFVRFDLTNATFKTTPVFGDFTIATTTLTALDAAAVEAGDNFVVVALSNTTTTGAADDTGAATTVELKIAALNLLNKDGASIKYRVYETKLGALTQDATKEITSAAKEGPLLAFSTTDSVIAKTTQEANINKISVKDDFKKFVTAAGLANQDSAELFTLELGVNNPTTVGVKLANAAGTELTLGDLIDTNDFTKSTGPTVAAKGSKLELAGNFVAAKNNLGAFPTDAFRFADDVLGDLKAASDSSLEFALPTLTTPITSTFTLKVGGINPIAEQDVTGKLTVTGKTGYDFGLNGQVFDLGTVASLKREGTSKALNLVFAPGSSYTSFVRISNTSNTAGEVNLTLYNDAGQGVTFPLSSVAGQTAQLAANASTTQMSPADLFAAALKVEPAFEAVNQNKLRLVAAGNVTGLDIQSFTVSKDGQALARFN